MKSNLALVIVLVWAVSASAITIDTVPVGNPRNSGDFATYGEPGRVNYVYRIARYEVTVGQYTVFLNAVAATDAYGLYNTAMATDLNIACIARAGIAGNYTYSVIGSPNHPITYVSWGDAARFANWLNNGQPTGAEDASSTEDGAYTLNGAISDSALSAVNRNANGKWVIPTDNEWFKAAYYQPASGTNSEFYWSYPMRTNSVPYSDKPPGATPDNTREGNFYNDDGLANGYDDGYAVTGSTNYSSAENYLTDVGAYTSSPGFYGTFDQGGNVWEWDEFVSRYLSEAYRYQRGGSWANTVDWLNKRQYNSSRPSTEEPAVGFRMAFVPEPRTPVLAVIASGWICLWRKRRRV